MDISYSEVRESESKAHSQAEILKNALDEHSLELRVKAANEAEAACEQRLSAAEAEIEDLRAKLDASERLVFRCTSTLSMVLFNRQTCLSLFLPLQTLFVLVYSGREIRNLFCNMFNSKKMS